MAKRICEDCGYQEGSRRCCKRDYDREQDVLDQMMGTTIGGLDDGEEEPEE